MVETKKKRPAFKARTSRLEPHNVVSDDNPYWGFFTCFWICIMGYTAYTFYRTHKIHGVPVSLNFLSSILEDGTGLFASDVAMVASCGMAVVLHMLLRLRIVPVPVHLLLQHAWQAFFMFSVLSWLSVRNWRWVQSGFFCLHSIAMLMKQHSYISTNREMEVKYREIQSLVKKKKDLIGNAKKADVSSSDKETIKTLDASIDALRAEITTGSTEYPANFTITNFLDYMVVPTLVYDLEYPRTSKFRLGYFLQKVTSIFATLGLLTMVVEQHILPVIDEIPNSSFMDTLMDFLLPFTVCHFLIFFIIFEAICNAFAEVTFFADRNFYDDWWNSTSFDHYARKWNRPVHEFLLRHVYFESLETYKLSKNNATFATFFLSACLHELVMAVVVKKIRFYLFVFQMSQLPLIYFARIPFIKTRRILGNGIFWLGMILGPPLIGTLYIREPISF